MSARETIRVQAAARFNYEIIKERIVFFFFASRNNRGGGERVLAARAMIKSQYYYRDLYRLPAVCGKTRSILEDDGNPCTVRPEWRGEPGRRESRMRAGPWL